MNEPYINRLRKGLPKVRWLLVYEFAGQVTIETIEALTVHTGIGRLFEVGRWPFGARLLAATPIGETPYWWKDASRC